MLGRMSRTGGQESGPGVRRRWAPSLRSDTGKVVREGGPGVGRDKSGRAPRGSPRWVVECEGASTSRGKGGDWCGNPGEGHFAEGELHC